MKFRLIMSPSDVSQLPDSLREQVIDQLPRQVELQTRRLERERALLEMAEQVNREWAAYSAEATRLKFAEEIAYAERHAFGSNHRPLGAAPRGWDQV